jgi:hypothetical protein
METEIVFDYASLIARVTDRGIAIMRGTETLYSLCPELGEDQPTALLRVEDRVSFYKVTQAGHLVADDVSRMLMTVMPQLPGGLFYVYGNCTVRNRKVKGRSCRSVALGTTQIAFRDQGLVFNTITTRSLGNVVLDDTGDTLPLYAQLNGLI